MSRRARQLRSRKKVILIWGTLLVVSILAAAVRWLDRFCSDHSARICGDVQTYAEQIRSSSFAPLQALVVLVPAYLIWTRRRKEFREPGFKNQPWLYDRRTLELTGRVEYVLSDTVGEKLKRKMTDLYRTATANDDWRNRYIHQRFLISSPHLRRRNNLLVLHNTKYGQLPLREGSWVRIKGEYLHGEESGKSLFGRRHFYGQIHYTHEPRGFLELLNSRPMDEELKI